MHSISTAPIRETDDGTGVAELVRRCQGGDTAAYETLYRAYVEKVYGLCLRLSGDPDSAASLTQEAFVRAWTKIGTFRGDAAFGSWLYRVAFNVIRQSQRSESRRLARIDPDADPNDRASFSGGLELDDRIDLERAIASLPARARNALILHDIHGFRCREVAEITGTAAGTIQAHLHRARRLLKEKLSR